MKKIFNILLSTLLLFQIEQLSALSFSSSWMPSWQKTTATISKNPVTTAFVATMTALTVYKAMQYYRGSKTKPVTPVQPEETPVIYEVIPTEEEKIETQPEAQTQVELATQQSPEKFLMYDLFQTDDDTPMYSGDIDEFHKSFQDKDQQNKTKIIIKLVHGTFSNKDSLGGGNEERIPTKSFMIFAEQLKVACNATVQLDSFSWSGGASLKKRKTAGIDLARSIAEDKAKHEEAVVWCIGHSHGCNVINFAAQKLKDLDVIGDESIPTVINDNNHITIDNAVFIASPTLDINPMQVTGGDHRYNITHLMNIYGLSDVIAPIGSVINRPITALKLFAKSVTSCFRKEPEAEEITILDKDASRHESETVKNIVIKYRGTDLDHTTIKHITSRFMAGIIEYINKKFPKNFKLFLDIYQGEDAQHPTGVDENQTDYEDSIETGDGMLVKTGAFKNSIEVSEWIVEGVISPSYQDNGTLTVDVNEDEFTMIEDSNSSSKELSASNKARYFGRYRKSITDTTGITKAITQELLSKFKGNAKLKKDLKGAL